MTENEILLECIRRTAGGPQDTFAARLCSRIASARDPVAALRRMAYDRPRTAIDLARRHVACELLGIGAGGSGRPR